MVTVGVMGDEARHPVLGPNTIQVENEDVAALYFPAAEQAAKAGEIIEKMLKERVELVRDQLTPRQLDAARRVRVDRIGNVVHVDGEFPNAEFDKLSVTADLKTLVQEFGHYTSQSRRLTP